MAVDVRRFTGFRPEAIDFLAELAQNNDRSWFQPRKADYERLLKEPMEALVAGLADAFATPTAAAAGRPEAVDLPDLPRHPVRQGQVALQDPPRRDLPVGRGHGPGRGLLAHASTRNGAYFHLQPGNNYVGGGMWHATKPGLDAFRQAIVDDEARVRAALEEPAFLAEFGPVESHDTLKRVPPGLSGRPPDGRPVPLQGRRLRPSPVGRRGLLAGRCPTSWPTPTRGRRPCSASCPPWTPEACGSAPRSGSSGPVGRTCATRASPSSEPGWDSLWLDDHLMSDEGDWERPQARGLGGARGRRRRSRRASGSACSCRRRRSATPGSSPSSRRRSITCRAGGRSSGSAAAGSSGEHDAFGIDFGSGFGERLDRLDEATMLIRRLLDGERVTHTGRFYEMHDALCEPRPVQARLPILIGGSGPTKTLRTTARYADLWNGYGEPDRIAAVSDVLRPAARRSDRRFEDIERTVTLHAVVRDTPSRRGRGLDADRGAARSRRPRRSGWHRTGADTSAGRRPRSPRTSTATAGSASAR